MRGLFFILESSVVFIVGAGLPAILAVITRASPLPAFGFDLNSSVICDTILAMSTHEKLFARMRNNPRDWRIDDLKTVANRLGIVCRTEGGSHHVFSCLGVEEDVCVPSHRPIKPIYVRQFLVLCDKAKEQQP
jgi:hypothetical protein